MTNKTDAEMALEWLEYQNFKVHGGEVVMPHSETIRKALTILSLLEQADLKAMCWNENMDEAPRDTVILVSDDSSLSLAEFTRGYGLFGKQDKYKWFGRKHLLNFIPTSWCYLPDNDTLIKKIMEVL
jgi:hypothetical protein